MVDHAIIMLLQRLRQFIFSLPSSAPPVRATRAGCLVASNLLQYLTSVSEHPELVRTMLAELSVWQQSVENSLTGADYK
jgi:hypothetical protein